MMIKKNNGGVRRRDQRSCIRSRAVHRIHRVPRDRRPSSKDNRIFEKKPERTCMSKLGSQVTGEKWWRLFDDAYEFDIITLQKGVADESIL